MAVDEPQGLVVPASPHWTDARRAAARAVAGPNNRRIAAAAAQLLTLDDNAADFAAWCDAPPAESAP